jgi:hypothetical protein
VKKKKSEGKVVSSSVKPPKRQLKSKKELKLEEYANAAIISAGAESS